MSKTLSGLIALVIMFAVSGGVAAGDLTTGDSQDKRPQCDRTTGQHCGDSGLSLPDGPVTVQCTYHYNGDPLSNLENVDLFDCYKDGAMAASSNIQAIAYVPSGDAKPKLTLNALDALGNPVEVDGLCGWEQIPEIASLALAVDKPGLVAKIRLFTQSPTGGLVRLRLNSLSMTVNTNGLSVSAVNTALLDLVDNQFNAAVYGDYLVVSNELATGASLRELKLIVTDAGLVNSEIALESILTIPGGSFCDAP